MKKSNYEFVRRILFDANIRDRLTLKNARGERIEFEQVFAVQRGDDLYCILRPLKHIEGLHIHSALLFFVDKEGNLRAIREECLSDEIFAEYYSALQKTQKKE